ncbi:LamG-like jellyroll fold domain-containing protein [Nucisporomicrobium flavum]|uniref:LamG-like jellyroll fold domain-containing protein n=1 Tax=Nucisporomicrobium flavum TaxID=2785915 RepID=UPI003C30C469
MVPKGAPGKTRAAPTERAALQTARSSGERVEVASERSELSQVFAEPDGRLTYEASVVPQRVHRPDGTWADVDLRLGAGSDGVIRPAASVADVRFSSGGPGPLATLVENGKSMTVSWPLGPLPPPELDVEAAKYREVLPGVDLVARATPQGFTHVLVVKSAVAAQQSELKTLTFELGGDAVLQQDRDGSLRAVHDGELIASAGTPVMWDSRTEAVGAIAKRAAAADDVAAPSSTAEGPGARAAIAELDAEITASGDLALTPDASLLASARYPVYIDPEWGKGKTRWAYATNNNTNNSDTSRARVGKDPDGRVYRSFFEFPTSTVKGKHIESAYVQMKLDHSWSCDNTWTHMFHSNAIGGTPRTSWSTKLLEHVSAAESHANEGGGCGNTAQNDMWVNFTGGDVTAMLQKTATNGKGNVTVAFSAGNESHEYETSGDRWKKFYPSNAKLVAEVDGKPGKPNGLQVAGIACTTSTIRIGTSTPTFSAIFPDADTGQSIKGTWAWYEVVDGSWPKKPSPNTTSATANTRRTTGSVSGAEHGKTYAFRVLGTDPSPFNIESVWSDWCYFTVDTKGPPIKVEEIKRPSGPGLPGKYRLTTTATDATTFRWGWNEAVSNAVTPVPITDQPGVTGKFAEITVTAAKYGINVMYVQAIDSTNNKGYGSKEIPVGRPSPAVARFGLETYPGEDSAAALRDQQPALGIGGDTPLVAQTDVTWAEDSRLIGGKTATLNGTTSQLTTGTPVVDTTKSFGVAGWVRLNAMPTTDGYVAAQDGAGPAAFGLGVKWDSAASAYRWAFFMKDTDVQTATTRVAFPATALTAADVGRWTHVAGSYDKEAKKIRLYLNGELAGEADRTASPWASGRFVIGRAQNAGTGDFFARASIADIQVFDRVVVDDDFTGQLADDEFSGGVDEPGILQPVQVGQWDFNAAVDCYQAGTPGACVAPDSSAWGRRLRLTEGTAIGSGNRGWGLSVNDVHYVDDPADPKYGAVTQQYGVAQRNTGTAQQPTWLDGPVLRTSDSFTVSVWVRLDDLGATSTAVSQRGTLQSPFYLGSRSSTVNGVTAHRWEIMTVDKDAATGEVYSHLIADAPLVSGDSEWTHLAMVYDAGQRKLKLYVDGELAKSDTRTLWNAAGPLGVGRAYWSSTETTGAWTDQWRGGIDDLQVYQGAMTDAQVKLLQEGQSSVED